MVKRTIWNVGGQRRNIVITPSGVTVNGQKVSDAETARLRQEASGKLAQALDKKTQQKTGRDTVVVQHANTIIDIEGDGTITDGRMHVRPRRR